MAKKVSIVLADGKAVEADVIKEHKDGCVDVELEHRGQPIQIHKCPRDDEGKKADSWRPLADAKAAEAAKNEPPADPKK